MKTTVFTIWMMLCFSIAGAQGKYLTNEGSIIFYSHTAIEDITADNQKVAAVIDSQSGEVAIIVRMVDFEFKKKLMQEHFNENYVESEKYPKATFNGRITNNESVDYAAKGSYPVEVSGELTIHGITKTISVQGTMEISAEGITARTKFMLNPENYGIKIPGVVRDNIAENMEITAELFCKPI